MNQTITKANMGKYTITDDFDPKLNEQLNYKIQLFNESKIGSYSYFPLNLVAKDEKQNTIGSLIGHTGLGWLYIDVLWVDDKNRNSGIGYELLKTAEEEAKNRVCVGSYLYTYSFQSPEFYEKKGYKKFGELPDFPSGHTKYFMKKNFTM